MNKIVHIFFGLVFVVSFGILSAYGSDNNCASQYPKNIKQQNLCNSMFNANQQARSSVVSGNGMSLTPSEQKILDQGLKANNSLSSTVPSDITNQGQGLPSVSENADQGVVAEPVAPIESNSSKNVWNRLTKKPSFPPQGVTDQSSQDGSDTTSTDTTHVNIYK
jgi:hypothetical protein